MHACLSAEPGEARSKEKEEGGLPGFFHLVYSNYSISGNGFQPFD
jgi:hypothetical protein